MSEADEAARRLEARVGKRFVEALREFMAWEVLGRTGRGLRLNANSSNSGTPRGRSSPPHHEKQLGLPMLSRRRNEPV